MVCERLYPVDNVFFNRKAQTMKVSKALLQTIAVAIAVATVSSACEGTQVDPKKKNPENSKEQPYDNCPGCGLG